MIKAIVFTILLASICSQRTWNVDLFRGNIAIASGTFNPQNVNNDVTIENVEFFEGVDAVYYNEFLFNNGKSNFFFNLRNCGPFTTTFKPTLGAIVSCDFTTDGNDQFVLSLTFGLCCNDFEFDEISRLKADLEGRRQTAYSRLAGYFEDVRREADIYSLTSRTLDELRDEHSNKKQYHDDLVTKNKNNEDLLEKINIEILSIEDKEYIKERENSSQCSKMKISETTRFVLEQEVSNLQSQLNEVESSLNNQSEVTEDDRSDLEKLYNELVAAIISMKAYNPRLPTVEFVKGKLFASDNLDVFYVSTQN